MNPPTRGTKTVEIDSEFSLATGGRLPRVRLAYETFGRRGNPCVVILGGLSADAHVASSGQDPSRGWWEPVVGDGLAIDTCESFVVCVNYLGGCAGSTGPGSLNPTTGKPYSLTFPTLTLGDLALGAIHVVKALGITDIDLLIGTSMGAMVAIPFMAQFRGTIRGHVSISGCLRASPAALALRGVQRDMVRHAYDEPGSTSFDAEQVKLARKIALLSYRPAVAWEDRFGRRPSTSRSKSREVEDRFEIQSYLETHANKYLESFDPRSFVVLSEALDLFDPAERPVRRWSGVPKQVLVMGARSDALYPPQQQAELAVFFDTRGASVILRILDTPHGHDSFLIDAEVFGEHVHAWALKSIWRGPSCRPKDTSTYTVTPRHPVRRETIEDTRHSHG